MTYLSFHLVFILPPILILGTLLSVSRTRWDARRRWAIPLISVVAFSYTIPWDNYLVAQNVWEYGADRVLMVIGFVPVEEYLFFVLQPVLTGLFLLNLLPDRRLTPNEATPLSPWSGFLVFALLTVAGGATLAIGWAAGFYMSLILVWASPLLAGMCLYGGETLWTHRTPLLYGTLLPTAYLCIADAVAIAGGTWSISDAFTLGIEFFGLPIEEATFFLLTNLLVVKGILLLVFDPHDDHTVDESTPA